MALHACEGSGPSAPRVPEPVYQLDSLATPEMPSDSDSGSEADMERQENDAACQQSESSASLLPRQSLPSAAAKLSASEPSSNVCFSTADARHRPTAPAPAAAAAAGRREREAAAQAAADLGQAEEDARRCVLMERLSQERLSSTNTDVPSGAKGLVVALGDFCYDRQCAASSADAPMLDPTLVGAAKAALLRRLPTTSASKAVAIVGWNGCGKTSAAIALAHDELCVPNRWSCLAPE